MQCKKCIQVVKIWVTKCASLRPITAFITSGGAEKSLKMLPKAKTQVSISWMEQTAECGKWVSDENFSSLGCSAVDWSETGSCSCCGSSLRESVCVFNSRIKLLMPNSVWEKDDKKWSRVIWYQKKGNVCFSFSSLENAVSSFYFRTLTNYWGISINLTNWHGVIKRKYAPPRTHAHTRSQLQPYNLVKFSSEVYIQRGSASRSAWLCATSGGFCALFRFPASPALGRVEERGKVRWLK